MRFKRVLNVVDVHAEGEVGKVIVGGVGQIPGKTMFDKRVYLETKLDDIRKMVLFEPRGAVWHNANIVLPSEHPDADMGFVILETTEYPAMSGSNAMCVATVLLETGILPMQEPVTELVLEAPAGLIKVRCECSDGKVTSVRLVNQPAFCYHTDKNIEVPGMGTIRVDVVYGGMTFAMVDAADLGFSINPSEARELCEIGEKVKLAAAEQLAVEHPENPQIPGITATEFMGPVLQENGQLISRNTVVVSPGRCDRSPCGTGSSARLALLHAKKQIEVGQILVHESITGSRFTCSIERLSEVGKYPAVVPVIAGQAWLTGFYQMGMDPTDPYQQGFTVSDTWMKTV
ncbi:proline racemase family protein [Paraburkholderia sp. SEWSISQ10-3 4]|uniref:proline racemase family protein n=1 Tax=Paraburkholderia TaxID=1822464 RepID=UPI00190972F2|nr:MULTISPECIES: proline racemase family protein [Paraburkholderia]MBK3843147.1 proline racemase family protein [Paraburkholderia aspalathi]MCX4140291.1 proline racemase family protein [Paraburkholderia aspalathi]MDN7172978.1 proline racemase family protein [Paraburkholderia sp. SEWSISQ10-3 4]MDQ6502617.1 proline racemase family protein [Paraburkholderia aspalathi]CAE6846115.1 putative trans-3-hydroxy-L-proline dehydratase [Paraburkholderia aspalathi]